jgi:hypothetical protein
MKLQDPDDLKPPHDSIQSLLAAFRQAWHEERNSNETQLPHTDSGQAPETTG